MSHERVRLSTAILVAAGCLLGGRPVATASTDDAVCVVQGTAASLSVTVTPAGGPTFQILTDSLPATAYPTARAGDPVPVRIAAPLVFEGTVARPTYRVAALIAVAGGIARLPAGLEIGAVTAKGALAGTSLEGDDVSIDDLSIPCQALSLDPVAGGPVPPSPEGGASLVARGARLLVRARPGAGDALRLRLHLSDLPLTRIAGSGGWVKVALSLESGVLIEGWVTAASVQASDSFAGMGGDSIGDDGGCGDFGAAGGPGLYEGPATLAARAVVYADRGVGAWAVAPAAVPVRVEAIKGDPWVQILGVRGLGEGCSDGVLSHAWAGAPSVTLPAGAFR